MGDTGKYGDYRWCIKVTEDLAPDGEIYVMADQVMVTMDGALHLEKCEMGMKQHPNLIIAAGKWKAIYAASMIDGHAVAVEHWEGEVERC